MEINDDNDDDDDDEQNIGTGQLHLKKECQRDVIKTMTMKYFDNLTITNFVVSKIICHDKKVKIIIH